MAIVLPCVVVGTEFQRAGLVGHVLPRAQDEHRHLVMLPAKRFQHIETVCARQHQVKNHQREPREVGRQSPIAACCAWCLFLAYDLLKQGYRRLGTTSMVAVASAVWVASDGLGHKRDGAWSVFWPEYTVMLVASLWFLALAIVLIALGRRVMPTGETTGLGSLHSN